MQLYHFLFLISSALIASFSAASEPPPPWKGNKGAGFLLIYADVTNEYATMHVQRISSPGSPEIEIKLSGHGENRWIRKALKAGRYQVTSIKVPYFDLPFRLDTTEDQSWAFRVHGSSSNYFGTVSINRERTRNSVDIHRSNRLASQIQELRTYIGENRENYPLTTSFSYRDDFIDTLLGN